MWEGFEIVDKWLGVKREGEMVGWGVKWVLGKDGEV